MSDKSDDNLLFGKIELGKRYSLKLEPKTAMDHTLALQYSFKPSNIDLLKPGTMYINENNETSVTLSRNDSRIEEFRGTSSSSSFSGQDNEYVLVFDQGQFKIRKLDTSVLNLRPIRADQGNFAGLMTGKAVAEQRNIPKLLRKVTAKIKGKGKAKAAGNATTDNSSSTLAVLTATSDATGGDTGAEPPPSQEEVDALLGDDEEK